MYNLHTVFYILVQHATNVPLGISPQIKVYEDTNWKTRILRQIHPVDPDGLGRMSCLPWNVVYWRDFLPMSDWISCKFWRNILVFYLQFYLLYIQLIYLWISQYVQYFMKICSLNLAHTVFFNISLYFIHGELLNFLIFGGKNLQLPKVHSNIKRTGRHFCCVNMWKKQCAYCLYMATEQVCIYVGILQVLWRK